jgi:two-component system sensor histidine kinase HydH
MIFVLSRDFQLGFVNDACTAMLGYTSEEVMNIPGGFLSHVCNDDRDRLEDLFKSAFASGGAPFSAECRLIHKRDRLVHAIVWSIGRPTHGSDTPCDHLEGIILDITDRVFLEKTVVQREKLKTLGAVVAEVAH